VRAEGLSFDSNGVTIHYTVEGQGEPVLLLHGFAVNSQINWVAPGITQALARDYRVITLDSRGHGQSGKPHDARKYGKEMLQDVVRLLDHLRIAKAHVVGYSMGGYLTHQLMVAHPDRVLTATLAGAGWHRENKLSDWDLTEKLAVSLEQGKGFGPLLVWLTPAGQPRPGAVQIRAFDLFLLAINDPKALAACLRSSKDDVPIPEEKLKANPIPTLALIGSLDPIKADVEPMRHTMANLTVVEIKGADHLNAFLRPEFVQHLQEFLARHRQAKKEQKSTAGDP
jgi:pimeloyl-ACP methyl ester carboxylesterase